MLLIPTGVINLRTAVVVKAGPDYFDWAEGNKFKLGKADFVIMQRYVCPTSEAISGVPLAYSLKCQAFQVSVWHLLTLLWCSRERHGNE